MGANAQSALNKGKVTEAQLDVLLVRLFKVRIRLSYFDPPNALATIGPDQVCTPYALELARDGVRQSVVLATNTGGVLPLAAAKFANVVAIG